MHQAVIEENKEIVELLVALGADLNARDGSGSTPLHRAARRGNKEIVELLIVGGASVNAKDKNGKTPLSYAKRQNNFEIVQLLRQQGAKEETKNIRNFLNDCSIYRRNRRSSLPHSRPARCKK